MATNKREQILGQLVTILQGVPGFVNVWRDRDAGAPRDPTTQDPLLPAAIVLDGKVIPEVAAKWVMDFTTGTQKLSPGLYSLQPQVWIVLMPRETIENINVGSELSDFEQKVIKAVTTDETLIGILGMNGKIEYRGNETDMQSGSSLEGQMKVDFAFTYVMNPADL